MALVMPQGVLQGSRCERRKTLGNQRSLLGWRKVGPTKEGLKAKENFRCERKATTSTARRGALPRHNQQFSS